MLRARFVTADLRGRIVAALVLGVAGVGNSSGVQALELREEPLAVAEDQAGSKVKEEPAAESVGEPSAEDAPVEGEPGAGEAPALPPDDAGDDAGSGASVPLEDEPKR